MASSLLAVGTPSRAEDEPLAWKLPEAEAQLWVKMLKPFCPETGWTVTAKDNDIILQHDKPVPFVRWEDHRLFDDLEPETGLAFKGTYRIRLRFAPQMSMDQYQQFVVENEATQAKRWALQKKYKLPLWHGEVHAFTDEEKKREQVYLEEAKVLVVHELPDLYAPGYSITYYQSWTFPTILDSDYKEVYAECNYVKEKVSQNFGKYFYKGNALGKDGRPEKVEDRDKVTSKDFDFRVRKPAAKDDKE